MSLTEGCKKNFLLVASAFAAGIVVCAYAYALFAENGFAANKKVAPTPTFSSTQIWDPALLEMRSGTPLFLPDWRTTISLDLPPADGTAEAEHDIATVLSYKSLRTPERIQKILLERGMETTWFGDRTIAAYMDEKNFPARALF